MKHSNSIRSISFCALLAVSALLIAGCTGSKTVAAPTPVPVPEETLYVTIARLDSLMFDAFNKHDSKKVNSFFSSDLEFYHDKGGLANYTESAQATERLFGNVPDLHRELLPGSLEVYPIKDYGAIEVASHRFCHIENGKEDCGTFKFLHIWKKGETGWKITRIVSYDH